MTKQLTPKYFLRHPERGWYSSGPWATYQGAVDAAEVRLEDPDTIHIEVYSRLCVVRHRKPEDAIVTGPVNKIALPSDEDYEEAVAAAGGVYGGIF